MPFSPHVKDFLHFRNLISRNNFRRDISYTMIIYIPYCSCVKMYLHRKLQTEFLFLKIYFNFGASGLCISSVRSGTSTEVEGGIYICYAIYIKRCTITISMQGFSLFTVCLFVCGISLTSSKLIMISFQTAAKSCFSQFVLCRMDDDCIYEMRCLLVAVGPNAHFIVLPHWDIMP